MDMSKKTQNIIYLSIIAVAIIVSIVLCTDFYLDKKNNVGNADIPQTASLQPKEDKVIVTVDIETIQEGLEDMGFLVTQEYYFTYVERYTKEKKVLRFFNSTAELAYSYDGLVTAGVDFEKIKVTKDDNEKTITIIIPDAEIQTVTLDKDSFQVYSEKEAMWNKLNAQDFNDSMAELEAEAKKRAIEKGILERAKEQAEELVMNFIGNDKSVADYKVICE